MKTTKIAIACFLAGAILGGGGVGNHFADAKATAVEKAKAEQKQQTLDALKTSKEITDALKDAAGN